MVSSEDAGHSTIDAPVVPSHSQPGHPHLLDGETTSSTVTPVPMPRLRRHSSIYVLKRKLNEELVTKLCPIVAEMVVTYRSSLPISPSPSPSPHSFLSLLPSRSRLPSPSQSPSPFPSPSPTASPSPSPQTQTGENTPVPAVQETEGENVSLRRSLQYCRAEMKRLVER